MKIVRTGQVLVLLLAGVVDALSAGAQSDPNLLLTRAKPLTDPHHQPLFIREEGSEALETYFWVSNSKLLLLQNRDYGPSHQPLLFDINRGTLDRCRRFNARFPHSISAGRLFAPIHLDEPNPRFYVQPVCALSPNGKWLVWTNWPEPQPDVAPQGPDARRWIAGRLDGFRTVKWPADTIAEFGYTDAAHPQWLPDSRHWMDVIHDGNGWKGVCIRSLDSPGSHREVLFSAPLRSRENLLGVTHRGEGLAIDYDFGNHPWIDSADFYSFDLRRKVCQASSASLRLPYRAILYDLALSPDGKKLAWLLKSEQVSPVLPGPYRPPGRVFSLWVSDLHGRSWQEIGPIYTTERGESFVFLGVLLWPRMLRWTPDGKRLSFVYGTGIRIVSTG